MKVFGTILVIIGGVSFFLYFLLWTLEDYSRERISMWPIFLWIFLILVGIILMGKQKKRTRY